MINFSKDDYDLMSGTRKSAFRKIAIDLGPSHPIVQMMGPLAWGRHNYEQGVDRTLRTAIEEFAFLEGFFDCLNKWTIIHDLDAQNVLLKHWPKGRETSCR